MTTTLERVETEQTGITPAPELTAEQRDRLTEAIESAHASSTRRVYTSAFKKFNEWADDNDRAAHLFAPETLTVYLTELKAEGKSLSSLETARAAVLHFAENAGADADAIRNHAGARRALSGLRKSMRRTQTVNKARALTADELRALLRTCGTRARGTRDAALLTVSVALGLRSSETVALERRDLVRVSEGYEVTIRASKASDLPITLNLARTTDPDDTAPNPLDPCARLDAWLAMLPEDSETPVFTPVDKAGRIVVAHMRPDAITGILQRLAERAGVSTESLTSHALRASFATFGFAAATPLQEIRRTGRWGSNAVFGYDRATGWTQPASAMMSRI